MKFSYTKNVRAQPKLTLQKIKNTQTQSQTTLVTFLLLCLFVCFFFMCLSYTFCLAVRFNCIKRAVFTKAPIFPAYSTNIVIVIFNKWLPLISDLGHPFAAHGLPFFLFLPVLTSGHPKCKRMKEWNISMWASGLTNTVCLLGLQDNG